MSATFSDALAESRAAFLELVRGVRAAYYEVYHETPDTALEQLFEGSHAGELLLRFDLRNHSDEARHRFRGLSDIERRAYEFPPDLAEKPIPYFGSFVVPFGHCGIAWTRSEVEELIVRTRDDQVRADHVRQLILDKNSVAPPACDVRQPLNEPG